MRETIDFLLDRAEALRELAQAAPELAADLRHIADELDEAAADLRRQLPRGAAAK